MRTPARGSGRARSRWCPALLAVVAVLATACEVETGLAIEVEDDGSGSVAVSVALDEAAAEQVPQLGDQLRVEDLEADGWDVVGPALEGDGRTWVRATKGFDGVEQAAAVLDEVDGAEGPFQALRLVRVPGLLRQEWRLDGVVDLTAGIAAFSDEGLREHLDGTDVGWTEEEVVAIAGRPLDEVFTFRVEADLPGTVTAEGPGIEGDAVVWEPELGERTVLAASGHELNRASVAWFAVAALAVVVALVAVAEAARRSRGRRRYRSAGEDDRR